MSGTSAGVEKGKRRFPAESQTKKYRPLHRADFSIVGGTESARLSLRLTLRLDDESVRAAREYTGIEDLSALMEEALKALIERESDRRRVALGNRDRGAWRRPVHPA